MNRLDFNRNWTVNGKAVILPRDEMLQEPRHADMPSGAGGAYFGGGVYTYRKRLSAPDAPVCILELEGAYRESEICLNGERIAENVLGTMGFTVDLSDRLLRDKENVLIVTVRNDSQPNARWYTGSGIYRPVWLWTGEKTHISQAGIRVSTPECSEDISFVKVETPILHANTEVCRVRLFTEIADAEGKVICEESTPVTLFPGENPTVTQRLYPRNIRLWNVDEPNLYSCRVTMKVDTTPLTLELYQKQKNASLDEAKTLDRADAVFGFRHVQIDPLHGLRINGRETKLRGACIHADNGILGAAEYEGAALFRMQKLKEAGFNAVRIAHQPASEALLSACDRLGMLLMEESFDLWTDRKSSNDDADRFTDHWRDLVSYTVRKDFNHPCVLFYSIGNEITMLTTDEGRHFSRQLSDFFRQLDPTRPVTNAINVAMSIGGDRIPLLVDMGLVTQEVLDQVAKKEHATMAEMIDAVRRAMASGNINDIMTLLTGKMNNVVAHPLIAARNEECYSHLDLCGYNYMMPCYEEDTRKNPNRIIFGSETNPPTISRLWSYVSQDTANLGDFTWTGWDYLGEVGVGITSYDGVSRFAQPYPALLAYCGDFDLTGHRRPLSYLREIVFGLRKAPYLSVELPQHYGKKIANTPWAVTETVHSWTWRGYEGKPIHVEIYAAGDEVALLQNGVEVSRVVIKYHRAGFDICYQAGTLEAIAYENGEEIGRDRLITEDGAEHFSLQSTRFCDLTYIEMQLTGTNGLPIMDHEHTVSVDTDAELLGFGSGDPWSEELFSANCHSTYRGRALVIVRGEAGKTVTFRAEGLDEAQIRL